MSDNHREIKQIWLNNIIQLVEEGDPDLGLGDKVRIKKAVDQFVDDYVKAQGEPPRSFPLFGDIYKIYNYIAPYGYIMPRVEKWIDTDMITIRKYAERKGITI